MSKSLLTDIFRSIKKSLNRFISIIIIVALGAGFFVGIKSTGPSMSASSSDYFIENNLLDIRIQSPIGLTDDDVEAIKKVDGVEGVYPQKFADALILVNGNPEIDIDGSQISTRAYGLDLVKFQEFCYGGDNKDFINRPTLIEGTYPTQSNQCLVDASRLSTPDSFKVGNIITLESDANADLSGLAVKQFQIVGIIQSPQYISFERGNSLVGSGKIGTFILIPNNAFTTDYYSEIYATVKDTDNLDTYSDQYISRVNVVKERIEKISNDCVKVRAEHLRETLPSKITDGEKVYNTTKTTVDNALKEAAEQVKLYQKYVDDPNGSYNEAVKEAAEALGLAEDEYNGNNNEFVNAVSTYNAYLSAYKEASKTQEEKYKLWVEATNEYTRAENALTRADNTVTSATQLVSSTKNIIESTNSVLTSLEDYQNGKITNNQLTSILQTLQGVNPDLYASISSLSAVSMATEAIALINPYLTQQKEQLAVYENDLNEAKKNLDEYSVEFKKVGTALDAAKKAYDTAQTQLEAAEEQLNEMYQKISGSQNDLTMAQIELMMGKNTVESDLKLLKATIANAQTYLDKAKSEYTKLEANAQSQLADAEKSLKTAKKMLTKLDSAKWNIYDRADTPGYGSYESAVNNVKVLSNIFPVLFFIVAALVCFTTMSRMVEEELTRMGTLKALGYSNMAISSKFILYALFASIIGSLIGIIIGIYVLPYAISKAYSIMFTIPKLHYIFPVKYIIIGLAISVLTTVSASMLACFKELKVPSATLMRPKAPAPGKRIFLEKIGFIWNRINFTSKVTARNIFRKKGRLIMTVFGIGGCTALILASIGLFASINGIMKKQFENNGVSNYDVQIVFAENQNSDSALMKILKSDSRINSVMLSSMQSVTGGAEGGKNPQDVYLFVPNNPEEMKNYISLRNRVSDEALTLNDSGAIVTEKFASDMGVSVGDRIWVEDTDGNKTEIPVAGITENYAFSYIYLTENLYRYLFQTEVNYNYALGSLDAKLLVDDNNSKANKAALATELMAYDGINAIAYVSDTMDTLNEVIGVLSVIIAIFILAAGLLAVTVLYNLSNINISERQRELATIKVLGFNKKEMCSYIYRESLIMTIIGIIFGLILGIFVHKILLIYCSVDTVMFVQTLSWYSYVLAAVATAVFSIIVNSLMKKRIRNVDMVESLKAIE